MHALLLSPQMTVPASLRKLIYNKSICIANEETRQRENETKEHSVRACKFISTGTEIRLVS